MLFLKQFSKSSNFLLLYAGLVFVSFLDLHINESLPASRDARRTHNGCLSGAACLPGRNLLGSMEDGVSKTVFSEGFLETKVNENGDLQEEDHLPLERTMLTGGLATYGYYYADILVGTPPQRQTVIVDTGSSLLGFTCQGCTECGSHNSKHYNSVASSTFQWTPCSKSNCHCEDGWCSYTYNYAEKSSISGFYFADVFALGSYRARTQIRFFDLIGCHFKETNYFKSQDATGILGIGYRAKLGASTPMDILLAKNDDTRKMFSLCLADSGGVFSLGGYEGLTEAQRLSAIELAKPRWTPIVSSANYKVALLSMRIGDDIMKIDARSRNVLIDSGTTEAIFPRAMYEWVIKHYPAYVAYDAAKCVVISKEAMLELPSIYLTFGGNVEVEWAPWNFINNIGNRSCKEFNIAHDNASLIVLGMAFMKNIEVVFDLSKKKIGFFPTTCELFDGSVPVLPDEEMDAILDAWNDELKSPDIAAFLPKHDKSDGKASQSSSSEDDMMGTSSSSDTDVSSMPAEDEESVAHHPGSDVMNDQHTYDDTSSTPSAAGSVAIFEFPLKWGSVLIGFLLCFSSMAVVLCKLIKCRRARYSILDSADAFPSIGKYMQQSGASAGALVDSESEYEA